MGLVYLAIVDLVEGIVRFFAKTHTMTNEKKSPQILRRFVSVV
jgi:hypothetical protein